MGGLVAEGIADDDKRPPVIGLLQPPPHALLEEPVLVRNLVDLPGLEQPGNMLVPGQTDRGNEPVAVGRFDLLAKRLEHVPLLGLVGLLAELAIELIETE